MIPFKELSQVAWLDKKFLVELGFRYGISAFLAFALVIPSCGKTGRLTADRDSVKRELGTGRQKITQAIHLQKNRQVFRALIRRAESRFFSADELPRFLSIVSDIAHQRNLQLVSSKPLDVKKETAPKLPAPGAANPAAAPSANAFYEPHKFEVELSGGYHSLGSFFSALKHHDKLIRVEKLNISSGQSPTDHEIRMTVAVFSKVRTLNP